MSNMNSPENLADEAWSNGETDYHRRGKERLGALCKERIEKSLQQQSERWAKNTRLQDAINQIEQTFGVKK